MTIIKYKEDIILLIEKDNWMLEILNIVKLLELPDWWICAGFVRSKIWDFLHNFCERTPLPDVDVIYYDPVIVSEAKEKELEQKLTSYNSSIPWSVKNQARMHIKNNVSPYLSSIDAISKFPETATALGVKLDEKNNVILTAPCGIKDVLNLKVKPTPFFAATSERMQIYKDRVRNKNWPSIWNQVILN